MFGKKEIGAFVVALLVLMAVGAPVFGTETGTHKIRVGDSSSLNGTRLEPGQYKLVWESHSPEVTVTILHGKKVVATAQGKFVDRGKKFDANAMVTETGPDGTLKILEIRLAGMSQAIVLAEGSASPQSALTETPAATEKASSASGGGKAAQVHFLGKPRVTARTQTNVIPNTPLNLNLLEMLQTRRQLMMTAPATPGAKTPIQP